MKPFDWDQLLPEHRVIAKAYLGELREPDRRITHDGILWFARFNLAKVETGNIFFHIQLAEDPKGLHTHPWDNTTVYLAGEIEESIWRQATRPGFEVIEQRKPGQVVHRDASWAHHLKPVTPYALTLFMTGPAYRHWGFWRDGQAAPNQLLQTRT